MRLLLDTHALLWFLADDPRLSRHADAAIKAPDTGVLVSVVSHIATRSRRGGRKTAAAYPARRGGAA